jgi:hypothetical protein
MERIQTFKDAHLALAPKNDFGSGLWENVVIKSASTKTQTAVFTALVPPDYGNHRQSAHGGAIATLFDSLTGCTLALISQPGYWVSLPSVSPSRPMADTLSSGRPGGHEKPPDQLLPTSPCL